MKGISHFALGVASASFLPGVVESAAAGNPLYFILGGVFGLLPDTLDFKFMRFFYRSDMHVIPDPIRPDAQMIADAVALAVNRAHGTGRPVCVRFHTIRLSADAWQSYEIWFDVSSKRVVVTYGSVVDTGGVPVDMHTETGMSASAPLLCDIRLDYQARTRVDILDGPEFRFRPIDGQAVIPEFIPWHRQWSHSVLLALLLGGVGVWCWGWLAGVVIALAHGLHIAADQLGHLGSNLLFPFSKKRSPGFRWMHSGEASGNFSAVWLACVCLFWNLYAHSSVSLDRLNPVQWFFYTVILPYGLYRITRKIGGGEGGL